jgi:queuine tRNA-ribosyltransferase
VGAHNIQFYHDLMSTMRKHILDDSFVGFYERVRERLAASDEDYPVKQPRRQLPKPMKPLELGDYEVLVKEGISRIRHKSSGETMHPMIKPEDEARDLYVTQSRLVERAAEQDNLVLWDVGMGAGANVMAAIHAFEEAAAAGKTKARLHIVSFEHDLDSLKLANLHLERFQYLRHGAPNAILQRGEWASKKYPLEWRLLKGNFHELLEEALAPDIIFYDPYSTKTCRDFWCVETLERIREHCEDREAVANAASLANLGGAVANAAIEPATELFTYSTSTAVRSSLLAAGFFVSQGQATGPKGQTTVALTSGALAWRSHSLLGAEWLRKWERSEARWPLSLTGENQQEYLERVKEHPQFRVEKI